MIVVCVVMTVMLWFFFSYHLVMSLQGTTTNERAKISDFAFYYEKKGELIAEWVKDLKKELTEREIKVFELDTKWNQ